MRIRAIVALTILSGMAAPLHAQSEYNTRVAVALRPQGRYQAPLCPLKGGDFHSASAGTYLKVASEGFTDDLTNQKSQIDSKKYTDGLGRVIKSATDALAINQQNAAGWYYLGRAQLQLGDLRGADSSLTRLEKISPDCAEEVKALRQKAWVVLVGASSGFMKNARDTALAPAVRQAWADSSIAVLRDAQLVARYFPLGFYNLAQSFLLSKPTMPDSVMFYFRLAEEKSLPASRTASDPQADAIYKGSTYDLAVLYVQAGDDSSAIAQYRMYLAVDSTDADARRGLASALRRSGKTAEAAKLEGQLMSSGAMSTGELAHAGVNYFNDKDYPAAADAFQKILATDPVNHDALYNLANTYLAMKDGKQLITTAQKLLDIDPLGGSNVRLLANGYQLVADTNKQVEVVMRLLAMPVEISIDSFFVRKDGAKLTMTATGKAAQNASGKTIPSVPVTLVVEFTNAQGAVVATEEAAFPVLAPDAKQTVNVSATGAGITAWRYHKK
ncbi:MAG: tetratricopeptide repeat protein [Gemmatimonadales bacterium]